MNKFIATLKKVYASLGLQEKAKAGQFTPEEQKAIKEAYQKEAGTSFDDDCKAFQDEQAKAEATAQQVKKDGEAFRAIGEALGLENPDAQGATDTQAILAAIAGLKNDVQTLSGKAMPEQPAGSAEGENHTPVDPSAFAFAVQNPFFATSKRYNRIVVDRSLASRQDPTEADKKVLQSDICAYSEGLRTRIEQHFNEGTLASLNFKAIVNDPELGRQFDVRQDALISAIMQMPRLDIFTKISNVQSGVVLTAANFSRVSQAYQSGHVFKGVIDLVPEKAIVDKCMTKLELGDMSDLETSYLNYLNSNGSYPIKWNLVEWIILELAKQIANERMERQVMGYRVNPTKGEAGETMFASTGLFHRLLGYYEENKVRPFVGPDFVYSSSSDIGDVLQYFAETLHIARTDWKNFVLYVNETHRPWYNTWVRAKYGKDTDFAGVNSTLPDYGLQIKWVPNLGNVPFIFATPEDNIVVLENKPGEENAVAIQQDLESVILASYWKEGVGARLVGEKAKDHATLMTRDFAKQVIFMNMPAVELAPEAKILDAAEGIIFLTADNSSTNAITDIKNAQPETIYTIEIGGAGTHPSSIAKAGKFAKIASAWNPSKQGEFIKVYLDAEGNFVEVERG